MSLPIKKPIVSVIMASYNHDAFVKQAIESVLIQKNIEFEFLIADDGSKDKTREVIQSIVDPRITFFPHEENRGACTVTNELIQRASGEYIALINSDDIWNENKLLKQVHFLDNHPQYAAVFGNAQIINEVGLPFKNDHFYARVFNQKNRSRFEWLNYFFYVGNCLCHPSMLIRKSVYDEVGLYNPCMASLPDFEMWVRLCLKYEIYIMPEQLIQFRILDNERNASGTNPESMIARQFENKHILDYFLNLSVVDYEKVFNEKAFNSVAFMLSLKAIESKNNFQKAWGLDLLYDWLKKHPEDMSAKEFTQLTRKNDIFNISSINTLRENLYKEFESSLSYRITQPLRTIRAFLKKIQNSSLFHT